MRKADEGATLVELLVSLAVLSIAMAGLGAFFVTGFLAVGNQRDQRMAVQVANTALEQVRGLEGSSLLNGRGPVKVQAQWSAALASSPYRTKMKRYLDSMQIASDPEIKDVTSTEGDEAPLSTATQKVTVGSATFERNIFVGRCVVYFMRTDKCVNPDVGTPPSNSAEILRYFRVVVLVTWPGKACNSNKCSYLASTLISEAAEPTFDSKAGVPVLVTTEMAFYVGQQVTSRIDVDYGQQPNLFSATTPVPLWLTMSKYGLVTGAPTAVGETTSLVRVTDKLGRWVDGTIKWRAVLPPSITGPSPSRSNLGDAVSIKMTATGGVTPYAYTAPDLPDDLAIDPKTGVITGTLPGLGTYPLTVTVEDANGITATTTFNHVVNTPIVVTAPAYQKLTLGAAVTGTASATGGDGVYKYTATGLPTGVTINATTGALSGTPLVAGRYLPVVSVTDGTGGAAVTATFEILVETTAKLAFTSPVPATPDQATARGKLVTLTLATNADVLLLKTVSYTVTGLPPGLKLNNGLNQIAGTPTTAGTYQVTITASSLLPLAQSTVLNLVWIVT
jgi:type II secretory pathway pseudopilin PulG